MSRSTLACLTACFVICGCGNDTLRPKVAPVHGTVMLKGEPLKTGDVMFTPSGGPEGSGTPASSKIGSDGSYTLTTFDQNDGAVLGPHKVTVVSREVANIKDMNKLQSGGIAYKLPKSMIAAKYAKVDSTPLSYTIQDGDNKIDIDLKE